MPLSPAPEQTPSTLRHADARATQQRAANADRRAASLADFVATVGGQHEAAEVLGITKAAVSKALVLARRRRVREPALADFVELDLPACGAQVPTVEEWQRLDEGEQLAAAQRSASTWAALAATWGRLHRQTYAASEWLAGVRIGVLDPQDEEDAAERPALVTDDDVAAITEQARDEYSPQITVLADTARALEDQARAARQAHDWWQGQADRLSGLTDV
ncbi:hypothetical protein [Streptomyces sp. NBC_01361]|uniref:hypothetical protein n=1 Tax=Streptomyces sp. NBC_01361 TaxID=2903838 RepID=UPI002E313656|nr:hypothetical protein [Streptomyces sp. NBC_01361]